MPEKPGYLRIADDLQLSIEAGDLPPGAKLPTESKLMEQYDVSRTVAKNAIGVLKDRGLAEGRRGSGVYVRSTPRLVRESHGRNMRSQTGPTSPFARDAARVGAEGRWEHVSEHTAATLDVGRRLAIEPGDAVMKTRYRFLAGDAPIQLSISWEPLALTAGTPIEWPEQGTAVGVVARFDSIGIRIDDCIEQVTARAASEVEREALQLPMRGAYVLVIERTYQAAGRPVETADIVFPGDRYTLLYRYPIE